METTGYIILVGLFLLIVGFVWKLMRRARIFKNLVFIGYAQVDIKNETKETYTNWTLWKNIETGIIYISSCWRNKTGGVDTQMNPTSDPYKPLAGGVFQELKEVKKKNPQIKLIKRRG